MTCGRLPAFPRLRYKAGMSLPVRTLLHAFPTFKVGGAQVRFAHIANHFGPRWRHLVVALDGEADCAERLSPDLDCEVIRLTLPKRRTLANYLALRGRLTTWRPDVLVTYNWGAIEWALADIPRVARHVHIEDGFGPEEAGGQLRRRVLFRRLVLGWGSTVVLPSRTLHDIACRDWRLAPERLRWIPNGVDCARFAAAPDPTLAEGLRRPGEVLVGTVAALRAEKNLPRLVDAFAIAAARLPARLAIVGEGPERAAVEAAVRRHGLEDRVVMTGAIAQPERVLGAFDLFALSSDTEQMPVSVLEAMAAGLPVAATDVGDVIGMVCPANRSHVVAADTPALAAAMLSLLGDDEGRRRIGALNRAHVAATYGQQTMFEAYAGVFDG